MGTRGHCPGSPALSDSQIVEDAINKAIASGIIVVGAAGNNSSNASGFIPGRVGAAVIVGASDSNGEILSASNYGDTVDYYLEAKSTSYAAARATGIILSEGIDALSKYHLRAD